MLTEQKIKELRSKYNIPEQGIASSSMQKSSTETIARRRLLASEYDKKREESKSRLAETWEDVKQMGSSIKNRFIAGADKIQKIKEAKASGEQGNLSSGFQAFGAGAGAVSQSLGDIFTGIVKGALSPEQEEAVKTKVGEVATSVMENPAVDWTVKQYVKAYQESSPEVQRNLEAGFNQVMLALDVFGAEGARQGIKKTIETGLDVMQKGKQILGEGVDTAIKTTKEITPKIIKGTEKAFSKKPPTSLEAVGQVLQGKPQDIAQGVKSFANIGVEDVKTFKDLGAKIKGKIVELSKQVDADLAVDTTKRKLNNLALEAKSVGGKLIKSNPVKDAIDHLVEVYTKVGEKVKATNMKELLSQAKKEGLTSLEINQLARDYGMEFGSKAFNKMGDALTSVNAKLYENTRKALKDLARQGIKGEGAKLADQTMSSLYNTERLIKKNIEAVNKLKQKIDEMGLVEKIGHSITKYTDKLSGGSLRGLIGGLLPRGAGYKVMNALDLEEVLQRNLKIIQDAIKSGNDKDIIKILEKLNKQ